MRLRRMAGFAAALVLFAALAGCSRSAPRPASTLTEAQRDSAIARSSLPGADVVGRAMQVSGREARRAAAMDSTGH
jgi:hypothetical protein